MRVVRTQRQRSLRVLNQEWGSCTLCKIGERADHHVFVDTMPMAVLAFNKSPKVDIVMIGEGPGKSEDLLGRPFVGVSGKLLRDTIEQSSKWLCQVCDGSGSDDGMPPGTACWACRGYGKIPLAFLNLVACKPSDEKGYNREPATIEVMNCMPRLIETICLLNPSMIVSVGKEVESFMPIIRHDLDVAGIEEVITDEITHPAYIARIGGVNSSRYKDYARSVNNIFGRYWEYLRSTQV